MEKENFDNKINIQKEKIDTIKIQYVSDLHLERYIFSKENTDVIFDKLIKPTGDILVICGDLVVIKNNKEILEKFFRYFSPKFQHIFYLMGNHEFYGSTFLDTFLSFEKFFKDLNLLNIHFLENDEYILDENIVFLGTTLWSDIRAAKNFHDILRIKFSISDYSQIWKLDKAFANDPHANSWDKYKNICCTDTQNLFDQNVKWLKEKLEKYKGEIEDSTGLTCNLRKTVIVLTHHLPSFKLVHKKYEGDIINYAFASNLDYLFEKYPNIKYWICGHTHSSQDIMINNTRCLINPAGYLRGINIENEEYKNDAVIEI